MKKPFVYTTRKTQIEKYLPQLDPKELRELRARIDFLLKGATEEYNADHMLVLDVIVKVSKDRGLDMRSVKSLTHSIGIGAFRDKIPDLMKLLGAEKLSTPELRAILALGLNLLVDHLQIVGITVSSGTLMNHIHRLPAIFNLNFPNYLENGAIKLLINYSKEQRK